MMSILFLLVGLGLILSGANFLMHLDTDTKLEIFVGGDAIVLKKHRPAGSCDFCGEVDEQAIQFGGYCICSACRRKLSAL